MKTTFGVHRTLVRAGTYLLAFLPLWARLADATDNHVYRADEYAMISGGQSADGRWSIAAHGSGDLGDDGFDLYLLREPTHEVLAPLRTGEHLDTGPLSIVALWAPDSAHVIVLYRSDRRILDVRLFDVAGGKVQSIKVPPLVDAIGQEYFKSSVKRELLGRYYRLTWQTSDSFDLEEFETFDATEPVFRAGLKGYAITEHLNNHRTFTGFSASAVCKITRGGKVRLLETKPLPATKSAIVYSPHLRFDPERGLYNTETTMSSLEAQKAQP